MRSETGICVLSRVLLLCVAGCATAIAVEPAGHTSGCAGSSCAAAAPQEITGVITVNRRLTKPSVTAPVSVYQRGTTVELGKDAVEDPIAYERSRVVIYLEGPLPAGAAAHHATFRMEQVNRRWSVVYRKAGH